MLTGLRALESLSDVRRRILIFGGSRRMQTPDGIEIVPVAEFLAMLSEQRLWP